MSYFPYFVGGRGHLVTPPFLLNPPCIPPANVRLPPLPPLPPDATQPAEGRARMCKDALLQVKENVFGVHRKGVVGRNRGGNIPKEPIVAHSAANPPHSSGQWMPTAISRSVLRMRSFLSLLLLSLLSFR
ncbi:hypothetical protein X777_16101 [Ooceraea biroi]|uniref:Uncharacterized protein n=1 Tax=Ooceraea biroi TaxID=2015173 RepID=A0A026WVA5_OOCBI|nr:hypothetical protein X777_16101 [Ooceraea biroi]